MLKWFFVNSKKLILRLMQLPLYAPSPSIKFLKVDKGITFDNTFICIGNFP